MKDKFMVLRSLFLLLVLVGCASTQPKRLKEIDADAPHDGHLFKLSSYVIEVADTSPKRLKFYFYDQNLNPISLDKVDIKKGVFDPTTSKQNYGIDFVPMTHFIEGIVHTEMAQGEAFDLKLRVKIDGHSRDIDIPMVYE